MSGSPGRVVARFRQWSDEVVSYAREAPDVLSFLRLMRVRLSLSKVGFLVCPKPIVVDVNLRSFGFGVRLRSHTTDISVLGEIVVSHGYDAVLPLLVGPVRTIIDLGANIGLVSRWFAARWPDARIACVEPEAGNVDVLAAQRRAGALRHGPARVRGGLRKACEARNGVWRARLRHAGGRRGRRRERGRRRHPRAGACRDLPRGRIH